MTHAAARTVVALALVTLCAHQAAGDEFTDQHARGVAANTYGGFSIRVKGGRTVFHTGERIQLELVYDRPGYPLYMNRAYGTNDGKCARVRFDQPVAEHLRVDTYRFTDGVPGGILGGVTFTPAVVRMTLTDVYRLAAGRYRMFMESRQITRDFEASNILEFEILPRDRAWEARIVARATTTLAGSWKNHSAVTQAFAELRALGSNEATAVLARFYETGVPEPANEGNAWNGLVSNPDRAFVVDALVAELSKPDRKIGRGFIRGLAHLELALRNPEPRWPSHDEYLHVMRQLAVRRSHALNTIPGRLESEIRRELSEFPSAQEHFVGGGLVAAARDFPRATTAAFRTLRADAQRSRLVGTWRRFADPAFLPLLRSLYRSPAGGSDKVRDIALRRLYELARGEGGPAMIAELRRDRPRASIETLGMLPDHAFPQLEARWVQQVENASAREDRTSAAQRLERFGTGNVAAAVEQFYQRAGDSMACATRAAVLAYIVRVDVSRGESLLTAAATGGRWDETCTRSLIEEVANLEWTPAVERATITALAHPDVDLVTSAAGVLAERGSTAAQRPLEVRLEEVQLNIAIRRRQADASAESDVWRLQSVEQELARALNGSKNWLLTAEERERLDGRCSDASEKFEIPRRYGCHGAFVSGERSDPPHSVSILQRIDHEHEFDVVIGHYLGHSLQDLHQKLRQFPPGTKVHWDDWPKYAGDSLERWTWSERDALFERFRREAATYRVLLQRERTSIGYDASVCPE
jgi:hypothetical protein